MLILIVVRGPSKGRVLEIKDFNRYLIGRERQPGKKMIWVPDTKVSRSHAAIFYENGHWHVEDLGSTNGTYINREQILGATPLEDGDQILVGRSLLVAGTVHVAGEPEEPQPEITGSQAEQLISAVEEDSMTARVGEESENDDTILPSGNTMIPWADTKPKVEDEDEAVITDESEEDISGAALVAPHQDDDQREALAADFEDLFDPANAEDVIVRDHPETILEDDDTLDEVEELEDERDEDDSDVVDFEEDLDQDADELEEDEPLTMEADEDEEVLEEELAEQEEPESVDEEVEEVIAADEPEDVPVAEDQPAEEVEEPVVAVEPSLVDEPADNEPVEAIVSHEEPSEEVVFEDEPAEEADESAEVIASDEPEEEPAVTQEVAEESDDLEDDDPPHVTLILDRPTEKPALVEEDDLDDFEDLLTDDFAEAQAMRSPGKPTIQDELSTDEDEIDENVEESVIDEPTQDITSLDQVITASVEDKDEAWGDAPISQDEETPAAEVDESTDGKDDSGLEMGAAIMATDRMVASIDDDIDNAVDDEDSDDIADDFAAAMSEEDDLVDEPAAIEDEFDEMDEQELAPAIASTRHGREDGDDDEPATRPATATASGSSRKRVAIGGLIIILIGGISYMAYDIITNRDQPPATQVIPAANPADDKGPLADQNDETQLAIGDQESTTPGIIDTPTIDEPEVVIPEPQEQDNPIDKPVVTEPAQPTIESPTEEPKTEEPAVTPPVGVDVGGDDANDPTTEDWPKIDDTPTPTDEPDKSAEDLIKELLGGNDDQPGTVDVPEDPAESELPSEEELIVDIPKETGEVEPPKETDPPAITEIPNTESPSAVETTEPGTQETPAIVEETTGDEPMKEEVADSVEETADDTPASPFSDAKRVVFLVDASGSQIDTLPLLIEKLNESLSTLTSEQKFTVIFFQDNRAIEAPQAGLKPGDAIHRRSVRKWMQPSSGQVIAMGSSNPFNALRLAAAYGPDRIVIFSDRLTGTRPGQVSEKALFAALDDIQKDNAIVIDTIHFFYKDDKNILKRIAEKYEGHYTYVEPPEPTEGLVDLGILNKELDEQEQ